MTSGFPGDFFYGGGAAPPRPSSAAMSSFRQPQQHQHQHQHQHGVFSSDQINAQRRADLLMGKRSFADFQSYQQPPFSLLQKHLQQQYLMRSVKQRSIPNNNNNNNSLSSSTRFGVPVYRQNQPLPLINNPQYYHHQHNQFNPTNLLQNPGLPVQPKPEDDKILNTLQELEKQLLDDDDNDDVENDAVSVITNSEWSETFQSLMSPSSNSMISPSPTSSTSSCCSSTPPLSAKPLISEAAAAISDGKHEAAMEVLSRLAQISNPKGNSEQRLAFYMGNALRSRACPTQNPPPVMELYSQDQMSAMYCLYDLSPCFKFGLLAANLVMLEAITTALHDGMKVHLIDFDVGHGGQYINLLRALAERRSQSELKVTVVQTEVGNGGVLQDGLVKLAEKVGVRLKFGCLTRKIHELTRESLGCEEGEAVVVNFAFRVYRVPDESVSMENLRDELLRRVKGLNPRAVTLVEQEMNGNTASFVTRVNEACGYYGALFDSLERTLPKDNSDWARVEEGLGRKMGNSVACEGRDRVERAEVFGKWRARMGMAGFELKPLSQNVAESMRLKLDSARGGNPGFTVKEESGGVGFGWKGRTLTVASAWR